MNRRRHNLCLLTESFRHGGTERQFTELTTRLDRRKYNVLVACLNREGEFYGQVSAAGLPVKEFPLRGWLAPQTAASAWSWIWFLRQAQIDLVHAFDLYTNVFLAPLACLARTPVVITSQRQIMGAYSPRQRWALRRALRWSDCVIANSHVAADSLVGVEGLPPVRVRVLHNGADLRRFHSNSDRANARHQLGLSQDALLVGVTGNLRPQKDHRTLLDAVPEVKQLVPNVHFAIVGSGMLEQDLRRYAEAKNLLANVTFLGDRSDIPEILAAIDLAVLPTLFESMPNVILEAMSAGRAVIASDVGGCCELIEHGRTGVLVPPRDARTLAKELVRLLEQRSLREEMGRAARRRAETHFDINCAVKRLEAIYDELLEQKQARGSKPTS